MGLQIRPKTYRGKTGFSIFGKSSQGQSTRIFAQTRKGAEIIRRAYKKQRPHVIRNAVRRVLLKGG